MFRCPTVINDIRLLDNMLDWNLGIDRINLSRMFSCATNLIDLSVQCYKPVAGFPLGGYKKKEPKEGERCSVARGPFCKHESALILAWVRYYIQYKVSGEITQPFPNFNGATVD